MPQTPLSAETFPTAADLDTADLPRNRAKKYTGIIRKKEFFEMMAQWEAGNGKPLYEAFLKKFKNLAKNKLRKRDGNADHIGIDELVSVAFLTMADLIHRKKIPDDNPVGCIMGAAANQMSEHLNAAMSNGRMAIKTYREAAAVYGPFVQAAVGLSYADKAALARRMGIDMHKLTVRFMPDQSLSEIVSGDEENDGVRFGDALPGDGGRDVLDRLVALEDRVRVLLVLRHASLNRQEKEVVRHRIMADERDDAPENVKLLTQRQLAAKLGITVDVLRRIEQDTFRKLREAADFVQSQSPAYLSSRIQKDDLKPLLEFI